MEIGGEQVVGAGQPSRGSLPVMGPKFMTQIGRKPTKDPQQTRGHPYFFTPNVQTNPFHISKLERASVKTSYPGLPYGGRFLIRILLEKLEQMMIE